MSTSDPLSFFAGEDSSSSDSENEENNSRPNDKDSTEDEVCSSTFVSDKLPSPDSLFASVGKPSFLNDPNKNHINWDIFLKNDSEPNIHLVEGRGDYAAIAPPKDTGKKVHSSLSAAIINTYSDTGGEISAPPIRYSTNEVEPKFRTVSDRPEEEEIASSVIGKHAPLALDASEESAAKKPKTEKLTFRQKEKRKRDLGQTSRGKSYVEEEKRVLRQQFSSS